MDPSSHEGLQLPPPVSNEQLPPAEAGQEAKQSPAEQVPSAPEQSVGAAQAAVAAVPIAPPPIPAQGAVSGVQNDDSSTTQTSLPVAADDNDLIEKEWVNKAKQIVERTRDDPYQQTEQLTVVKSDYMKKRYDKTIKLEK